MKVSLGLYNFASKNYKHKVVTAPNSVEAQNIQINLNDSPKNVFFQGAFSDWRDRKTSTCIWHCEKLLADKIAAHATDSYKTSDYDKIEENVRKNFAFMMQPHEIPEPVEYYDLFQRFRTLKYMYYHTYQGDKTLKAYNKILRERYPVERHGDSCYVNNEEITLKLFDSQGRILPMEKGYTNLDVPIGSLWAAAKDYGFSTDWKTSDGGYTIRDGGPRVGDSDFAFWHGIGD